MYPEAKRQVEICIRIEELRRTHFRDKRAWPTELYIGQMDFYNLRREADLWNFDAEHTKYKGLEIFRVDRDHHLRLV